MTALPLFPTSVVGSLPRPDAVRALLGQASSSDQLDAAIRDAVALQENAGLMGQFLWFSWPSNGDALNYTHDEADLYWSVPNLADTISELEGRFGPGRVNVAGLNDRAYVGQLGWQVHEEDSVARRASAERGFWSKLAVPEALLERPYLRPIYDDPIFIVRTLWRLYGGGNWDDDKAVRELSGALAPDDVFVVCKNGVPCGIRTLIAMVSASGIVINS